MTRLAFLLGFACLSLIAAPSDDIRKVLDSQVDAWNHGDLDAFLSGYEKSADVVFVGKKIARGYDQLVKRYRESYGTPGKMGKLAFSDLEIHVLDEQYANVIGRFRLERSAENGGAAEGVFTLLFRKTPSGWKIIQDHTS